MPLTPQDMFEKMKASVATRTGHGFEHWIEVARAAGLSSHKALTEHMKQAHGLNHNEAQWAAWGVLDPERMASYSRPTELEDTLYSGKRAPLRPTYEAALAAGLALGPEVRPNVCRTYTSLSARVQFAVLNPRTLRALDLELALPPEAEHPRLERFQSSNPKLTHRVRLERPEDVDDAARTLLAQALAFTGR